GLRASFCLGELLQQTGRLDEALVQFQTALALTGVGSATGSGAPLAGAIPSRADVFYRMADVELARGRLAESARLNAECLALEPDHYWGRFLRALILWQNGD